MELGKHQGSHCKDYNTHISQWQVPFQRVTSRQAAVRARIRCHFLSPLWNTDRTTITIFTTQRHLTRLWCWCNLSQHLQISSGSCAHYQMSCLACRHLQSGNNTSRWWDSREEVILWSYVSEPLFIARYFVSLSPLHGAKWHARWHYAGFAVALAVSYNSKNMKWKSGLNWANALFGPRATKGPWGGWLWQPARFPCAHAFLSVKCKKNQIKYKIKLNK